MARYSLATFYRIYDDETGEFIEVREDPDGLGLVEMVQGDLTQTDRFATFTPEQIPLLIEAMTRIAAHIKEEK